MLEAYKNIDGLATAWRLAAPRAPGARLHVVGKGSRADVAEALVGEPGVRWDHELAPEEVAAALDEAWVLVLPSRSEGMGRVLVEAFCRGRGVIGTRAGSIPDLVDDGVSGCSSRPTTPAHSPTRSCASSPTAALAERLGTGSYAAAACGSRRRRSTRGGCESSSRERTNRPRVLFVSRERFRLPLDGAQKRKWDALRMSSSRACSLLRPPAGRRGTRSSTSSLQRARVCSTACSATRCCRPGSAASSRSFGPDVALVQGVHETSALLLARRLTRSPVKIVIDIQGDWREATRLYGSPLRRLLSPLGDALGPFAVSRADAVRTISVETTALVRRYGREPVATFAPYVDVEAFNARAPAASAGSADGDLRRRPRADQGLRHARRSLASRREPVFRMRD